MFLGGRGGLFRTQILEGPTRNQINRDRRLLVKEVLEWSLVTTIIIGTLVSIDKSLPDDTPLAKCVSDGLVISLLSVIHNNIIEEYVSNYLRISLLDKIWFRMFTSYYLVCKFGSSRTRVFEKGKTM